MNWFVNSLAREGYRENLVDGLKAFVRLYFEENTDATEVEPDVLAAMEQLLAQLPGTGPSEDVVEIVTAAETEINDEGGVRSDTDGTRHRVETYKED